MRKRSRLSIKNTPVLFVIGDDAKDHPRWFMKIRAGDVAYAEAFKAGGGSVDFSTCPTSASRATRT